MEGADKGWCCEWCSEQSWGLRHGKTAERQHAVLVREKLKGESDYSTVGEKRRVLIDKR